VILLLVDLLIFPPGLTASSITWIGGTGNYSNSTKWNCAGCGPTYPNNTNPGGPFDAIINSGGTDIVNLDISAIINSMSIGGSESSTFNVTGGNNITFGTYLTTGNAQGNVLAISNGGILNVNNSGATLNFSGGGNALNDTGGQINVTNGGTLTLQSTDSGGSNTLTNNGTIGVSGATLVLDGGGTAQTFTIGTAPSGNGSIVLSDNANNQINGAGSQETLVISGGTNLSGAGTINVANFTNGGTLAATSTTGNALIVNSNLTNWTAGTGTLNGGQYIASGTLQLSSIGVGNSIQTVTNANLVLQGPSALITGDGTTNALSGLTNITDASVNLTGVTGLTITPGTGTPGTGTLTMTSDPNGTSELTLDQSSNVTVNGGFHNLTTTDTAPNTSTLTINNGSTLTITGNLLNEADVDTNLQSSTSTVNVLNGSTLNVDSLTTSTNNGFANSDINVNGSSLNVTHDVLQGGAGPNFSGGDDTLNLTNSSATVGGNFQNNNGLNNSVVNLNNSTLTVDGSFTQSQANGGFGTSQLNLTNNSMVTVGGFTNPSGVGGTTPQSLVSITNNSGLTVLGNGTFTNVNGAGVLSGGSYLIGTGSSLNYNGVNISTIDVNTVLTLDNMLEGAQGAILNGGNDAISNSLTTVNGTLALQNGANLTLAGLPTGTTFTVGANGTLSLLNSSNLDVSAYNFANVNSAGLLSGGSYLVGSNSTLNYAGPSNITGIDLNTSLTLDNANFGTAGSIRNSGSDALSNSLAAVNGTLTVQNNASLVLSSSVPSFTVGANGTVSVISNSFLDVSATVFNNVTSGGVLSGGTYFIGTNSTLNYSGPSNINTIDVNTSLTLDNIGGGITGSITNGGSDALSNSLTTNNGNLTLQDGASLALGQGLTNSSADTPTGSATANLLVINGSTLNLNNGASDLTNSATSSNGNSATSTVSLGGGVSGGSSLTVNNLTNTATNTSGSFSSNAVANINLTGASSLTVNGNLNNSAIGSFNASAVIGLDGGSSLTVGGAYNNTSGTLGLTNGSMATIAGLFTNDANSTVNVDATGNGLSVLTTNGGVSNAGAMNLNFFSTLNNTGTFSNSGTINLYNVSALTSTGLFDNTNGTLNLNGGGNTVTAAGFTNTFGTLFVGAGDTADFRTGGLDTFTNLSNGTLTAGAYNVSGTFEFDASAGAGGGQFQTITQASVAINGTGQILYGPPGSQGDALAAVTNMSESTLAFNDAGAHTITPVPSGGVSTLTLTDSTLNLSSTGVATETSLTVAGNLVNNSVVANGAINLTGSNLTVDGSVTTISNSGFSSSINLYSASLNSTLTATGALINGAGNNVNLNGGGNMLIAAGLTNNGAINVGAGDTADFRTTGLDTFTNLSNGTLTGGSLNVSGNFYYDASAGTGGGQILSMQSAAITLQGSGQILYGSNGSQGDALAALTSLTDSSLTLDSLNASRTITPGGNTLTLTNGQIGVNSSSLEVAGSVVMNTDNNGNSGINLSAGNLKVDGSITNNASSFNNQTINLSNLSTLTATGALINSSAVNLNGGGNQLFATGLTNNGTINVGAGDTADFRNAGAGRLTTLTGNTLSGGVYNLSGQLFYDTGSDTSTYIQTLNGATMSLSNTGGGNPAGAILFGTGAGTDGLAQLGTLTNSNLTLSGQTETFNPNGSNATFALNSSNLELNAYNTTPTVLTIQGALQTTSSAINIFGGSNLTVQGGVTNGSGSTISLSGGSLFGTSLTNNGTLNVEQASDTADFRSGAGTLTTLTGNTLTGGTYNITGSLFYNTGSDGSTYIQKLNGVNMTLGSTLSIGFGSVPTNALTQLGTLTNSALTINGGTLAINPNGNGSVFMLDPSTLTLNSGTVLNIAAAVDNMSGSSLTLSGAGTTLTANGFTNGGSLAVGAGSTADFRNGGSAGSRADTFTSLDGSTGTLNGNSYDIAGTFLFDPTSGANGGNILKIGSATTLTLDGTGGGAQVLYGPGRGTDALASLNEVAGTLNLYNGETRSFTPSDGTLTVDSGGTMNLGGSFAGTGVANITGGVANAGTINVTNSGSGLTTTGSFLNTGTLNVNNSGDFVTSQGLNNMGGTINIVQGATLDARTGGTNTFSNLDGTTGTLGGGGTFNVGGSFIFDPASGAAGGNIYVIGTGTTLALTSPSSQVLYGPSETNAIANLTEIAGTLNLFNGASPTFTPNGGTLTVDSSGTVNLGGSFEGTGVLNVTGALANGGMINLTNSGSGLTTTGSFLNTGTVNVNSSGDFVNSQGLNNMGGTINIASGATLDARTTGGFNTFSNLDGTTGTLGGGGTFNVGGSFLFDPSSGTTGGNIYVIGAGTTVALTSAAAQVLYGPGSGTDALASLTEITGTLTLENSVTHTFTPTPGTLTIDSPGTLNFLGQYATATVTGALTNNGTVNINGDYGTFVNNIGYEALNVSGALTNGGTLSMSSYDSVLNVGAGLTNNGTVDIFYDYNTVNVTGALANNNAFNISGYQNVLNVSGDLTNAGIFTQGDNSSTTVNVTGNLKNAAGGAYTVGYGNTTNVTLALSNAATGNVSVNGNGTLAVTLGVDNSGVINVGVNAGSGTANGSLTAGAPFVNEVGSALNVYNGSSVTAPGSTNNGTLAVLAGGLANFQGGAFTNLSGGTLTGGTYKVGGTFEFASSSGVINKIATGTSVTLDAQNSGAYKILSGSSTNALANLAGNAGNFTLTNGAILNTDTTANSGPGTFTNTGTLATTGTGSNAFNVTGNFANTSPGAVNLNGTGDTLTATGQFANTGAVSLNGNNASLSSKGFDNQSGGTVTTAGSGNTITSSGAASNEGGITFDGTGGKLSAANGFTNTGTLTTSAIGSSNSVSITGSIFNTSPGVVNLNGVGDRMTATAQFTNTGGVNLNGNNASVSSVGLDNQSGGTFTLAASGNSVTSTGTASNDGTITFSGTGGTVSSTGDFTNSSSGILTVTESGNALSTGGNLFNSGDITAGSGGSVMAALGFTQSGGLVTIDSDGTLTVQSGNTYDQTGGKTTVDTGGSLTAGLFHLQGGTLTGGGTIKGNLTVDGGTLNPGDPQSISVTGNYDQTLAGILDVDLASPSSYDQLDVGGTTTLSGTLNLTLEPGFDAAVGTVFDIAALTGAVKGNFSTFNDQTFDGGTRTFVELINGQQVDLDVVSTTSSTPEPSTLGMMLCAMLVGGGITWRVRRRSTDVIK
jgi:hypothetical protein